MSSIENIKEIQKPLEASLKFQRIIIMRLQYLINDTEIGATQALYILAEEFYTTPKELLRFLLFFAATFSEPLPSEFRNKK